MGIEHYIATTAILCGMVSLWIIWKFITRRMKKIEQIEKRCEQLKKTIDQDMVLYKQAIYHWNNGNAIYAEQMLQDILSGKR